MPRVSRLSWLLAVLLTSLSLPAISRPAGPERRPSEWAIKLERPGLPNLYKVNDGLYHGAQPTSEGVKELERLGIKTIVCLRLQPFRQGDSWQLPHLLRGHPYAGVGDKGRRRGSLPEDRDR